MDNKLEAVPWNVYPRPRLKREIWQCLNGEWELQCGEESCGVIVPYPLESELSKCSIPIKVGNLYTYKRRFRVDFGLNSGDVWVNFGAIMRSARVYVNGRLAAEHEDGYLPFSANITDFVNEGENELRVDVINDLDPRYPYGKQREKRGGMWYTPCTGIWQTVWLEPRPNEHITGIWYETRGDKVTFHIDGVKTGMIIFEGKKYLYSGGKAEISVQNPEYWSPEKPRLYDVTVIAGEDEVQSYFALRDLEIREINGKKRLCLNGKPYFFHALLDQGYWACGLYTPAGPEAFAKDIAAMKSLGFNTLRKHIKIEPELYYYACDKLGMAVFQDMVNSGKYHYIRDTVMPTAGIKRRLDDKLFRNNDMRRIFLDNMERTVKHLRGFPSIVLWTIFNEGWGQFESDKAYDRLKSLDPTRFIDSTSGWYHGFKSDVDSLHIYFEALHPGWEDKAQLISEYGGWSYKIPEHSFNLKRTYGYRKYKSREEFVRNLRDLFQNQLIPLAKGGLCGAVYTQLSDVEDETNGLLTYDRAILKLSPRDIAEFGEKLQEAVREREITAG